MSSPLLICDTVNCFKESHSFCICTIVAQANVSDFKKLVENPNYPSEQRVLRLENLPQNCMAEEIKKYFEGLFLPFAAKKEKNIIKSIV